jgi:hypothetical protein
MDLMILAYEWGPLSAALFVIFLIVMLVVAVLLYVHRVAFGAWFLARWTERSTAQARALALATSLAWLSGYLHITDPVPFHLVVAGWFGALALFVKTDAGENPRLAAPGA